MTHALGSRYNIRSRPRQSIVNRERSRIMRWAGGRQSEHVEDRRGARGPVMVGGLGMLLLALVVWFLGGNPMAVLQQMPPPGGQAGPINPGDPGVPPGDDKAKEFVSVVLADTE